LDEYKKAVWASTQTIFLYSVLSFGEYKKTVWVESQTIFVYLVFSFGEYKKTVSGKSDSTKTAVVKNTYLFESK